jgi:competence protein ComEC
VDINHAGYEDLQRIIHIGPERAAEIIELRARRRFSSVDDLTRVNGIGPARIRDIKDQGLACVSPPEIKSFF